MKKRISRILSILLTIGMVFTSIPVSAYAEEISISEALETVSPDNGQSEDALTVIDEEVIQSADLTEEESLLESEDVIEDLEDEIILSEDELSLQADETILSEDEITLSEDVILTDEIPDDIQRDGDGDYVFDIDGCDFIVTVKGGSGNEVTYNGGGIEYTTLSGNHVDNPGYLFINTAKPVTVSMRPGVEKTAQWIQVSYLAHGEDVCAHITLDNVKIDRSEYVPFLQAYCEPYLDSDTGENGYGSFAAFSYLGQEQRDSGVTLTLVGDNELIGPTKGSCGSNEKDCYGIYLIGGWGLGLKGTGSLKTHGGAHGIKVSYGPVNIEDGKYDLQDVVMDDKVHGCITGGLFKDKTQYVASGTGTVYGIWGSREKYGPEKVNMYRVAYNQDPVTSAEYPIAAVMTDDAGEYMSHFIGRQAMYDMGEDYGRAYDTVYAGAVDFAGGDEMDVSYHINNGFTMADTTIIKNAIVNDHPEFIWLWGTTWGGFSRGVSIVVSDTGSTDPVKIARRQEEFDREAKKFLYDAGITPGMSDLTKAYILYREIIEKVKYNTGTADQSAYEAFVNRQAVCAGYAKAFVYLLQQAGIEASYVPGEAMPAGAKYSSGHAWVLLKVNGSYYHADPTWDDKGTSTDFKYFCVPWSALSGNHWIDELGYQFPQATASKLAVPSDLVTVTASSGSGGSVYPSSLKLPKGSPVTVTIVPDLGMEINEVKVNGTAHEYAENPDGSFGFILTEVTSNQSITVSFSKKNIEVTKYTVGDFNIYKTYGGEMTSGIDYSNMDYNGRNLLIYTADPVTVELKEGVDKTTDRIICGKGRKVNLTLKGVTIDRTGESDPYGVLLDADCSTLHLTLEGTNNLIGNANEVNYGIRTGNISNWANYSDGELVIDGGGTISISNVEEGIEYTHLTIKDGRYKISGCTGSPMAGYMANETVISGGWFAEGNVKQGTVYGLKVANGCKVVKDSGTVYPFKVTGGTSGESKVAVTSLDLIAPAGGRIKTGKTATIKAEFNEGATDKGLVWYTDDSSVARVDSSGKVTGKTAGQATITAVSTDNPSVSATCTVTIYDPVSKLAFNMKSLSLGRGELYSGIKVNVTPVTASSSDVEYTCSDTTGDVLSIVKDGDNIEFDSNGAFSVRAGDKTGKVTITARATDGSGKSASLTVTVGNRLETIAVSGKGQPAAGASLAAGKTLQLSAVLNGGNKKNQPANRAVTWEIVSAEDIAGNAVTDKDDIAAIARIDSKGKIKAVSAGKVNVKLTHTASGKTASYPVRIFVPMKKLAISDKKLTIKEGRSDFTLSGNVTPITATLYDSGTDRTYLAQDKIKWTVAKSDTGASGDPIIKIADPYAGTLTVGSLPEGKDKATAVVTATATSDGAGGKQVVKTASCTITVVKGVSAARVIFDRSKISAGVGSVYRVSARVLPSSADDRQIKFSSGDEDSLAVTDNGDGTASVRVLKVPDNKKGQAQVIALNEATGVKGTCTVTVGNAVTDVKITTTTRRLVVGKSLKIKASVACDGTSKKARAANAGIKWTITEVKDAEGNVLVPSKYAAIASIDSKGKLTAKGPGTVTVRAESLETPAGGVPKSDSIEVTTYVPIKKLGISAKKKSVGEGRTGLLWISSVTPVTPVDPADIHGTIHFTSSNPSAVQLAAYSNGDSLDGLTFAAAADVKIKDGQKLVYKAVAPSAKPVTITGQAIDGSGKKVTCKLTVLGRMKEADVGIKITAKSVAKAIKSKISVTAGDGAGTADYDVADKKLTVTGLPLKKTITLTPVVTSTAADKTVMYRTGDPSIATVSKKGVITAKGRGTTLITMTTSDGGFMAECTLVVE